MLFQYHLKFRIKKITAESQSESEIKSILYSIESYSSHPIAKSIQSELKEFASTAIKFKTVQEDKGIGINATTESGDL